VRLSAQDRVMINGGLALIHDARYNPNDVTSVAQMLINMGTPPRKAYDSAFKKFVEQVPSFHSKLQRLGAMVDASDIRTVAAYNVALTRYNETGDSAALQPIMATVARDIAQMAVHTGDAGFADFLTIPAPAPASPDASTANEEAPARAGWGPQGYRPSEAQATAPVA
jgi:hypothetical protein